MGAVVIEGRQFSVKADTWLTWLIVGGNYRLSDLKPQPLKLLMTDNAHYHRCPNCHLDMPCWGTTEGECQRRIISGEAVCRLFKEPEDFKEQEKVETAT